MKKSTNLLLIAQLCSAHLQEYLFETSKFKTGQAGSKFYKLLADGFAKHYDLCSIEILSAIPVTSKSHTKLFWNITPEIVDKVNFNYVPIINIPLLKSISVFFYSFTKVLFWGYGRENRNNVVICDVLGISTLLATILATKLNRVKSIAIVTDLPHFIDVNLLKQNKLKQKFYITVVNGCLRLFDGYILLTEQMNSVVNIHNRPYLVMEGQVDFGMISYENKLDDKSEKRILLYAGGLYEKYGVKKLIEAFLLLEDDDLQLSIYGSGEMEEVLPYFMNLDSRIVYHGVVQNYEVVLQEIKATLLINPRSSKEEFAKYSFPSKNLEYMVSGTPMVTTLLPGMPKEYTQFVYLFHDESVNGIYLTLRSLLKKSRKELHEFGLLAKQFTLDNKSNIKQAERVLNFIETI